MADVPKEPKIGASLLYLCDWFATWQAYAIVIDSQRYLGKLFKLMLGQTSKTSALKINIYVVYLVSPILFVLLNIRAISHMSQEP